MYRLSDIRQLHIETSTRCNAECPMCCRNLMGRTSPGLTEQSMTLDTFGRAVPDQLLDQLQTLDVCGAYGDPLMAGDLLRIVRHVRRRNLDCEIRIFTNGGLRDEHWWRELGAIGNLVAVFAIDGLATNQVYRRRVDLDRVLRNARAFVTAGGRAQWDYIVFAHNEHELERARQVSQELGFETFAVKRTARFLKPLYEPVPEVPDPESFESFPIHDRAGRVVGELRPPSDPSYINDALVWARTIDEKASYLQQFFDACEVECSALHSGSLFMSVSGHVYPCCWTYVQATLPQIYGSGVGTDTQVRDLLVDQGGEAAIDATTRSIEEILDGGFFAAVEASWSARSLAAGKLRVCARVCGKGFDAYRRQFERPELVP